METQTSKAQLEVWEWKELAWREIRDLPKEEQLPYIVEQASETVALIKAAKEKKKLSKH